MRKEAFCEVFGDIREDYVQEARAGRKVRKPVRFKWAAVAACLCLALALPLAALAVDTVRYNAAVDYLTSLGIPAEDLGGYSRAEIKEAAKTIDAGESSALSEEILSLLPGTGEEPAGAPAQVTSEQVRALTPDMTREEVLALLGGTQDVGSGIYVYVYEVDGKYLLRIPFAGDGAQLGVTGEELLKSLTEK